MSRVPQVGRLGEMEKLTAALNKQSKLPGSCGAPLPAAQQVDAFHEKSVSRETHGQTVAVCLGCGVLAVVAHSGRSCRRWPMLSMT